MKGPFYFFDRASSNIQKNKPHTLEETNEATFHAGADWISLNKISMETSETRLHKKRRTL
jgi:hypothetical protein